MLRKVALALLIVMTLSLALAGTSAPAQTCRRLVVTIMDDPFFAHPICTDLPLVADDALPSPPTL